MRGAAFWLLLLLLAPPLVSQPAPPLRVLRTGGLKAETAALLMSGQQGGGLRFAVLPLALPGTGERARVVLLIEIDGSDLLAGHDESAPVRDAAGRERNLLRCEIAAYALNREGAIQGSLAETVELDLDQLGGEVAAGGLRFVGELSLLPGEGSLRVLVRNLATGNAGLKVASLAVPGPAEPAVLPPLVATAPTAWVTARSVASPPPGGEPSLLVAWMGAELPAARPVLALGRPAAFLLPAYRLAEGSSTAKVRLHRPGSAEPAAELAATVSAWRPGSGIATLAASFTPAGVEPGEYELSVAVAGAEKPSVSLPVVVVEAAQADRVWAALDEAPSRGGEATPAAAASRRSRLSRRQSAAFLEGYRAALARLAQGDAAAAQRAIAELELGALAIDAAVSVEDLAELEAKVLAPLGEADPEAVLPVLALYRVHYGEALANRRYLLASHARQLAFSLADFVGARSTTARVEVANFLALFGADILARTRTSSFSRWAFDRALELDPQNEATLLCLAIDAEKRNALREAIGFLKQLLSHQPAHREAQLRLAVAQKRLAELGSGREVEKLLAGLVGGEASDWIAAVAFQELARLHLDGDALDKARQVLEQGLARFPDDEKLLLLAAALARRAGTPGDAEAYVARLAPAAEGAIGPRLRYGSFPEALLARADDAFAAASSKSGARLAAALAAAEKRKRR